MIQTDVRHTPYGQSPHAARQRQTFAVIMLALFYVVHNVGSVFFQARKVPTEHGGGALVGYFAGVLAGALFIAFLERREAWKTAARAGRALRLVFLGVLLFPSVFCQVSFQIVGYAGTFFLNSFQPMLWAMHLPVAVLLFFRHVRVERQALFFGLAVSAGHLCWSLVMPLISPGPEAVAVAGLESRYLPLLNLTRNLAGAAFAALCWKLAEPDAAPRSIRPVTPPGLFPARRFLLLLLPFLACSFFNGYAGYLFFPRLIGRGLYPEYMHLALVLLFPLAGLLITRRGRNGETGLFRLILVATLSFAVFPLLLFLPGSADGHWTIQAGYLVCAAMQQALLFCGLLVFFRFARFSRLPALVLCAGWLAAAVSIPGRILAAKVLPALGISALTGAFLLAGLCLLSLLALRRAFPLPEAEESSAMTDEMPNTDDPHPEAETKLQAFAAAFGLSTREMETLSRIADKEDIPSIAAEMDISERTVRFHLTNILKKTDLPSRQRLEIFFTGWKP